MSEEMPTIRDRMTAAHASTFQPREATMTEQTAPPEDIFTCGNNCGMFLDFHTKMYPHKYILLSTAEQREKKLREEIERLKHPTSCPCVKCGELRYQKRKAKQDLADEIRAGSGERRRIIDNLKPHERY